MNITLAPETQRLLEDQLRSGQYADPDEVLRAALNALHDASPTGLDEETLDAIDEAEDQIERGQTIAWEEVRAQIRARFITRRGE